MSSNIKQPVFRKIIVVDDNEVDRYIAQILLKRTNFCKELVLIESGKKALAFLTNEVNDNFEGPNLLILDIRMPDMNGFEFLHDYEKLPEIIHQHWNIMMLSTSLDAEDARKSKSNPYVSYFVNKPLNEEKINLMREKFTRDTEQ